MIAPNIIRVAKLKPGLERGPVVDIILNSKECQLLLDKTNEDASWDLMCKSIAHREGIEIIGNYELISYRIGGIMKPLH